MVSSTRVKNLLRWIPGQASNRTHVAFQSRYRFVTWVFDLKHGDLSTRISYEGMFGLHVKPWERNVRDLVPATTVLNKNTHCKAVHGWPSWMPPSLLPVSEQNQLKNLSRLQLRTHSVMMEKNNLTYSPSMSHIVACMNDSIEIFPLRRIRKYFHFPFQQTTDGFHD